MDEVQYLDCLVKPSCLGGVCEGLNFTIVDLGLPLLDTQIDEITHVEDEPFLVDEHKVFHLSNFLKSIGMSLVLAEGLTLVAIGMSALGVPPIACKIMHGLSCGVSKNVTMVQYADLFKQSSYIKNIDEFIGQYLPQSYAKFISEEIAVTGLSIGLALASDARSKLTLMMISQDVADELGVMVPPTLERVGGVIVKRLAKDIVNYALEGRPYCKWKYFPVANTAADITRGIAKDYYTNQFASDEDIVNPLDGWSIAKTAGCSLVKAWGGEVYKCYFKGTLESIVSKYCENNSFSFSYIKNLVSSTFSSFWFTVCQKYFS